MLRIKVFEGELGTPSSRGGYIVTEHDDGTVTACKSTRDGMCSAKDVSAVLRKTHRDEGVQVFELFIVEH